MNKEQHQAKALSSSYHSKLKDKPKKKSKTASIHLPLLDQSLNNHQIKSQPQTSKFSQIKMVNFKQNQDTSLNPQSPNPDPLKQSTLQLSPSNDPAQKSTMKQKLIQILGGGQQEPIQESQPEKNKKSKKSLGNAKSELSYPKDYSSEIFIGNKVFQVSPKNNQQRFFENLEDQDQQKQRNIGYCISPKSAKHKNHKSQTHYQNSSNQLGGKSKQNQTEQNIRQESIEQKKRQSQKRKSVLRQNQKQNLFSLIKTINQFMCQSKQRQKDELTHINSYLEKNSVDISKQFQEFVKSFPLIKTQNNKSDEVLHQSNRTSLLNLFKQLNQQEILAEQQVEQVKSANYRTRRPPQLDTQQTQPNFLSYKNSLEQREINYILQDDSQEKNLAEESMSSPQFQDIPNSSSTNIQAQQKEYSSILNSQKKVKRIKEQELDELVKKTRRVLDKNQAKLNRYKNECERLSKEVAYWKQKYLEVTSKE